VLLLFQFPCKLSEPRKIPSGEPDGWLEGEKERKRKEWAGDIMIIIPCALEDERDGLFKESDCDGTFFLFLLPTEDGFASELAMVSRDQTDPTLSLPPLRVISDMHRRK